LKTERIWIEVQNFPLNFFQFQKESALFYFVAERSLKYANFSFVFCLKHVEFVSTFFAFISKLDCQEKITDRKSVLACLFHYMQVNL
jgi:low temperature requirement protein LtrA